MARKYLAWTELGASFADLEARIAAIVAGAGGAPLTPNFLVTANTALLPNERALAIADGLNLVDGGAGAALTIGITNVDATKLGTGVLPVARLVAAGIGAPYKGLCVNAAGTALEFSDGRVIYKAKLTADLQLGNVAITIPELQTALEANTRYSFRAIIPYWLSVTASLFAGRAIYSATVTTSTVRQDGTNGGAGATYNNTGRINIQEVNDAMPATLAGIGATGNNKPHMMSFEGYIHTNAAGNFDLEFVCSVGGAAMFLMPGCSIRFTRLSA